MIKKLLHLHEGLRLFPYRCTAGKLTIGIGRNLEDKGISLRESYFLLENDVNDVRMQLIQALPWYSSLPEVHRAVLEDMAFNMGVAGLLQFRKFLDALHGGRFKEARREMFNSRWAFQVGDGPDGREDRADRLARMVLTGQWPAGLKEG